MAETDNVIRAELRELKSDGTETGYRVAVQFNPETLKVNYANQLEQKGDQGANSSTQYVGKGTTKMSVQLWFDVTGPERQEVPKVRDVRDLTKLVVYFMQAKEAPDDKTKKVPPGVRFLWGSFQFDGIMESLEESLEFFSPEGRPLRASMTLNLTQQKITEFTIKDVAAPAGGPTPGTRPLTEAPANKSLQSLADGQGKGGDWQSIAAANNIENPRMLEPGALLDMNASASIGGSFSAGVSASSGIGGSAGASASFGASSSFGASGAAGVGSSSTSLSAGVQASGGAIDTGIKLEVTDLF